MAVSPQAALPVTITDADPNIPGTGTALNAASVMPNFTELRDKFNTHTHTDVALSGDLTTHTQLTTTAHGGIVADADARVNSFFNTSRIASTFQAHEYIGNQGGGLANSGSNVLVTGRVVAPFTGTLFDLSIFVGTASGNIIAGIYNTASTRASQYNCGSTPVAGTNAWQTLAFNSTLSTTVNGNQTVAPGANLTVASTTGFAKIGSINVNGASYAYTAVPSGTTITLTAGGTFTNTQAVTQTGFAVTAGQHLDIGLILDNGTATVMRLTNTAAMTKLPTNNFLQVSGTANPKLSWTNSPGSFTWPGSVTEVNAAVNGFVPLIIARVA